MKSSTARAASTRTTTMTTNAAAARDRASTMPSPEPSPPTSSGPRRTTSAPTRQSPTPSTRTTSSNSPSNSPSNSGATRPTRRQSTAATPSMTVKGFTSPSSQQKKPTILSHDFLTKPTPTKPRGPSMLTRSIDESPNRQLRHHPNKPHDYMSKSHDHGSLASYRAPKSLSRSQDRGPRSLTSSLNKGPMSLSKSQDRGLMSKSQDRGLMSKSQDRGLMSKSQDRGLMSTSQDRGSLSGYASARKVTVPAYGFDGRRLSTGSRDVTATHRMSDIKAHYGASQQLQMGRSVDSTVSLSSSQRQSFRDTNRLQFSDPVGYRSGDATPDETSPLDARAPASGLRTRHRQLKSPDFFDVKKAAGDAGGVITAVSRMHHDPDPNPRKQHATRRDSLAGSARNDTASSHSSEISYKLEKELSSAHELLEIGSWNEDDEEYLRIYKGERTEFVDILEDTKSPSKPKNWAEFSRISEVGEYHGQYDNALYEKSEPESDLSEPASPPRAPPATKSRISSTSATSIDLNRSTDTTCSTRSQYDNAFWSDPPSNPTFRPWNPKHESAMTPAIAPDQSHEPAAEVAADARMLRYNDGLERLTSYMKTASLKSKRGVSDDMSSSQASGCFDYLVDFLETQQSITDVLVSAHGSMTPKRLDAANDAASMLSSRSVESRVTDLGSEASWESGKSRSVQTLGASGKVMDQITEKVDSLSFDSPKHLSTFKFGLKKTTVGAFETITSSDQDSVSENWAPSSQTPSRTPSQRTYPDEKKLAVSTKVVTEAGGGKQEEEVGTPAVSPFMCDKQPVTEFSRKVARQVKKQQGVEVVLASLTVEVPLKDVQMHSRSSGGGSEVVVSELGSSVRLVESASMKVVHSDRSLVKHDRDSLSLSLNQANKGGCGCNIL